MVDYLSRPICHDAFFKKYANKKFMKGKHHAPSPPTRLFIFLDTLLTLHPTASVLSRNWAKLNKAHFDILDAHLSLDQLTSQGEGDEFGPIA
jgi:hypothetical protein